MQLIKQTLATKLLGVLATVLALAFIGGYCLPGGGKERSEAGDAPVGWPALTVLSVFDENAREWRVVSPPARVLPRSALRYGLSVADVTRREFAEILGVLRAINLVVLAVDVREGLTGVFVQALRQHPELTDLVFRQTSMCVYGASDKPSLGLKALSAVSQLPHIVRLELHSIADVDPATLEWLTQSPGLSTLVLEDCDITDLSLATLGPLTRLRTLRLRSNPITDTGVGHLLSLRDLRELDLGGSRRVTDCSVARIAADLTQLQSLNLEGCNITDGALAALARLPSLRYLSIVGCNRVTARAIELFENRFPDCQVHR